MKLYIEHFTTLLLITFILLAGCSGCAQKTTPEPKSPVEATQDIENRTTTTHKTSGALPTEFYPPENPYQDITINGEAPPFDFYNNPVYWIPDLEYRTVAKGTGHRTYPIIPDYDVNAFNTKIEALEKERGEVISREEQHYIRSKMRYGHLTPLNAAKAMLSRMSGPKHRYLLEVAQQALDANPNDFHTLLIWTEAQPYQSESSEKGYRQLLEIRPNNPYVLLKLGLTIKFESPQESIQLFKKAVQYAPAIEYGMNRSPDILYNTESPPSSPSVHVRDWALQELAIAYFLEGEKQKSTETFQYLQQITESKSTRKRATDYLTDLKEGYKFGHILLRPTTDEGNTTHE